MAAKITMRSPQKAETINRVLAKDEARYGAAPAKTAALRAAHAAALDEADHKRLGEELAEAEREENYLKDRVAQLKRLLAEATERERAAAAEAKARADQERADRVVDNFLKRYTALAEEMAELLHSLHAVNRLGSYAGQIGFPTALHRRGLPNTVLDETVIPVLGKSAHARYWPPARRL